MSLFLGLVSHLLEHNNLEALKRSRELGVVPEALEKAEGKALQFIYKYVEEYGSVPAKSIFQAKNPSFAVYGFEPDAPLDYYCKEILKTSLSVTLNQGMEEIDQALREDDPYVALNRMEKMVFDVRCRRLSPTRVTKLLHIQEPVEDYYARMAAGETGVETPWDTVNKATQGFWPEDLVLLVGHTNVGKTWLFLLLLLHAYRTGKRVLIVTTEMSQLRIFLRMIAVYLGLPFGLLRRGLLNDEQYVTFKEGLKQFALEDRIFLIGGDFDFQLESIGMAIEECKPDILGVDGAYLLKSEGRDRFERAANVFNDLKRLAKAKKIPVLASSQFNREAKKGVAAQLSTQSIALTDAASWNADLICALHQDEDMKRDKRMILKWLKARDSWIPDMEINWDVDNGNFDEISSEHEAQTKVEESVAKEFDGVDPTADDPEIPF